MSIATQIQRLQALKQRLMTKVISWGEQPQDLDDCVTAVESIDGTFDITDTNAKDIVGHGKRYARVADQNLIPGNIVNNVTILGVTGTASVNPPQANIEKNKTWYYGGAAAPSWITPSSGYDAMAQVTPELTDASPALVPTNIKNGAIVMGVTGTYQTPTESKSPSLSDLKTSGITEHSVNILPSSNNKHLSQVTIPRITHDIDSNIIAANIKKDVTILGVTGTASFGSEIVFGSAGSTAGTQPNRLEFTLSATANQVDTTSVYFFSFNFPADSSGHFADGLGYMHDDSYTIIDRIIMGHGRDWIYMGYAPATGAGTVPSIHELGKATIEGGDWSRAWTAKIIGHTLILEVMRTDPTQGYSGDNRRYFKGNYVCFYNYDPNVTPNAASIAVIN